MSTSPDTTPEPQGADDGAGFPRWLKWSLLGALAILVVGYGAVFLYAKVINDSPDELAQSDLDAALAGDDSADVSAEVSAEEPASDASGTVDPATAATGVWSITDVSELGYRVTEVLFGVDTDGVGRTNQVDGALMIDGAQVTEAEFVVDVATIESDDGRRDNQFRGRIMSTDEFPTATFTLTEPIELGTESVEGATVETSATGDLTLRGVTNSVTFDVSAKQEAGKIGVLGSIPVVFADYEIANPSVPGITTEEGGLLEFVLVFEPAV